jgi:hypothetical protein
VHFIAHGAPWPGAFHVRRLDGSNALIHPCLPLPLAAKQKTSLGRLTHAIGGTADDWQFAVVDDQVCFGGGRSDHGRMLTNDDQNVSQSLPG